MSFLKKNPLTRTQLLTLTGHIETDSPAFLLQKKGQTVPVWPVDIKD